MPICMYTTCAVSSSCAHIPILTALPPTTFEFHTVPGTLRECTDKRNVIKDAGVFLAILYTTGGHTVDSGHFLVSIKIKCRPITINSFSFD